MVPGWIELGRFIQLYSVLFRDGSDLVDLLNYILYCSGMDRIGYIYSTIFCIVQGWIGLGIFIQLYSVLFRDGSDWVDEDNVITVFVVSSFRGEIFERLQVTHII